MGSNGLRRRNIAISVLIGVVCIALVLIWVNTRAKYVTVINNVDGKTLSQVELTFHQSKIPYEISGSSIEVASSQLNQARIELAKAGLPKEGTIQKYH